MSRHELNQYDVVVDSVESSLGSSSGLYATTHTPIAWRTLGGLDSLDAEEIADPTVVQGGGQRESIEGPKYTRIAPTIGTVLAGLGVAAGDAVQAGLIDQGHLMRCCLGTPGDRTTGSTPSGVPTTIETIENDAGNHDLAAGSTGLVLLELVGGGHEWAAYNYATDTLTHLTATTAACANTLYGAHVLEAQTLWAAAYASTAHLRFAHRGGGVATDVNVGGVHGTFAIPATGANALPLVDYALRGATADDLSDLAGGDAAIAVGQVLAGNGQLAVGAFGSTAMSRSCADSIAFDANRQYDWSTCISVTDAFGVDGFTLQSAQVASLTAALAPGVAPPGAIASGSSSYRASRRIKGDRFHVLQSFGTTPGRASCIYIPHAVLARVVPLNLGGNVIQEIVTWAPAPGTSFLVGLG